MNKKELKKLWQNYEDKQKAFIGWDFSAIKKDFHQEKNLWCYSALVRKYLTDDMALLDMGTGGGELLATFNHPYQKTAVTEGWEKNYNLLKKSLSPKGVTVRFVDEDDRLDFPDSQFDIVLNSHESFSLLEVKRVLKPNGLFISQQVGDLNGVNLASRLLPDLKKEQFNWHLSSVLSDLKKQGFELLYHNECYPAQKFYSMEALIYYVKTISWEFPGFTVESHFQELLFLRDELKQKGYIYNQQHRFIVAARLKKN